MRATIKRQQVVQRMKAINAEIAALRGEHKIRTEFLAICARQLRLMSDFKVNSELPEWLYQLELDIFNARIDMLNAANVSAFKTTWKKARYILGTIDDEISQSELNKLLIKMDNTIHSTAQRGKLNLAIRRHIKKGFIEEIHYGPGHTTLRLLTK